MKAIKKRNYKKEYAKFGSKIKAKKYRAKLNQINRRKGTYGNGDGKDLSHTKKGNLVQEPESDNRARKGKK